MDLVQQITARLAEEKKSLGVTELVVFESTNGFILASTVEGDAVNLESLGSLTSGLLTALDMLSDLFAQGKVSLLLTETNDGLLLFRQVEEHYFLLAVAPKGRRLGYLQLRIEKTAAGLRDLVSQFIAASEVKISDLDIEQIQIALDAQFDDLFKGEK